MKIHNYTKINDAYLRQIQAAPRKDKHNAADKTRSNAASRKDEIVLSPRATEIRELGDKVKTYPEVRQGKVEAVKQRIQSNAYTVNGKMVAESILHLLG